MATQTEKRADSLDSGERDCEQVIARPDEQDGSELCVGTNEDGEVYFEARQQHPQTNEARVVLRDDQDVRRVRDLLGAILDRRMYP